MQVQQAHQSGHLDSSLLHEPLAWLCHAHLHEYEARGGVLGLPVGLHNASLPARDRLDHLQLFSRKNACHLLQDVTGYVATAQLEGTVGSPSLQLQMLAHHNQPLFSYVHGRALDFLPIAPL